MIRPPQVTGRATLPDPEAIEMLERLCDVMIHGAITNDKWPAVMFRPATPVSSLAVATIVEMYRAAGWIVNDAPTVSGRLLELSPPPEISPPLGEHPIWSLSVRLTTGFTVVLRVSAPSEAAAREHATVRYGSTIVDMSCFGPVDPALLLDAPVTT